MRPWRRAARDLQVDRPLPFEHFVFPYEPLLERADRVQIETSVDAQFAKAARQSSCMTVPFEEATPHDASHLVHTVAEEEAAIVDGEPGFASGQKLAAQIYDGHETES